MSANERRAEIIRILEGRRQDTVANLAAQLNVSQRTIRYDVETLTAEHPIETARGNGGCVRLHKSYRIFRGDISDEQQAALMTAIRSSDKHTAMVLGELLRAHGSIRNKSQIEEVIRDAAN